MRSRTSSEGTRRKQSRSARAFTTRRLSSIGSIKFGNREFGNRTHRKVSVRLCLIAEPIEKESNDWSSIDVFFRIGSIGYVGQVESLLDCEITKHLSSATIYM